MKEIERERRGKHYEVTGGQGRVTEEGGVGEERNDLEEERKERLTRRRNWRGDSMR